MTTVTEDDLFGRFFLRVEGAETTATYHRTVATLTPFLRSSAWQEAVTGWYLNISSKASARLSYFTDDPSSTRLRLEEYLAACHAVTEVLPREGPGATRIAAQYGEEELRFRRFLCTYSPLALDLMEANLLHARCLLVTLRCQLFPERRRYRDHLEPSLLSHSPRYAALPEASREQFWSDMQHWPNAPQVDWAHMVVNMVLGYDFMDCFRAPAHQGLSIGQINAKLERMGGGFRIPANWRPGV